VQSDLDGVDDDRCPLNRRRPPQDHDRAAPRHVDSVPTLLDREDRILESEEILWGVDVLIGGPPCQPFSSMGERKGEYDPRDGFPLALRAIDELRPRRIVFENVRELLVARNRPYLERLMADLGRRFAYTGWWRLNAADYGVPQDRIRVFLWAAEVPLVPPVPTHGAGRGRPWKTTAEALPHLRAEAPAIHVRSVTAKSRSIDEPSPTVATKGTIYTSPRAGLVYGKDPLPPKARRLLPEELALLSGFPGMFAFTGNLTSRHRQVGNAVPPPLGLAVMEAVLAGIDAPKLTPRQALARLKRDNPHALLFEPREVWDSALVGVTNISPRGDGRLVAVYDHGRLLDRAFDEVRKNYPEYDEEEAFEMASSHVWTNMHDQGMGALAPIVLQMEDPLDWETE
jgi:DNA (cytosine-5)-methyltransferase 1